MDVRSPMWCWPIAAMMLTCPVHADVADDLLALRGQVVLLDFWASWCGPCQQSFPWMQTMKDRYGEAHLVILAVNLDHTRADADKFLSRLRPGFNVRFDSSGASARHFNVHTMPTSLLIDRQGMVRFTHVGFRTADESRYEDEIRSLMAEP
jgi:cytochrome c biogenesis protein CcmG, thiol:disulfide interchange protein DsbE